VAAAQGSTHIKRPRKRGQLCPQPHNASWCLGLERLGAHLWRRAPILSPPAQGSHQHRAQGSGMAHIHPTPPAGSSVQAAGSSTHVWEAVGVQVLQWGHRLHGCRCRLRCLRAAHTRHCLRRACACDAAVLLRVCVCLSVCVCVCVCVAVRVWQVAHAWSVQARDARVWERRTAHIHLQTGSSTAAASAPCMLLAPGTACALMFLHTPTPCTCTCTCPKDPLQRSAYTHAHKCTHLLTRSHARAPATHAPLAPVRHTRTPSPHTHTHTSAHTRASNTRTSGTGAPYTDAFSS